MTHSSVSGRRRPASWAGRTFELLDGSGVPLVALPPSIGPGLDLGTADPYTYDRAPGSAVFFALGDGLPPEPPRLILSGGWTYSSVTEALTHVAEIEQALLTARSVYWRGRQVATLTPLLPGVLRVQRGATFATVTLTLTLNLTAPLTNAALAGGQLT